jgi:hypothetical protein
MKSSRPSEPLDLDDGLPVTEADIEALDVARFTGLPDTQTCLDFLSRLPAVPCERLRTKPGPHGEPFRLP